MFVMPEKNTLTANPQGIFQPCW